MHVKWQKTETTGRLQASLSQARRVNGAVKQQHIGMLATLRPADPRRPTPAERAAFWEQAQASLDRLQDRLTPGQRGYPAGDPACPGANAGRAVTATGLDPFPPLEPIPIGHDARR